MENLYMKYIYIFFYIKFNILLYDNTCIRVVNTFCPFFNHIGYTPIFLPIKPVRLEPGVHVAFD